MTPLPNMCALSTVHDSAYVGSLVIPSPQCQQPLFWGETAFPLLIYYYHLHQTHPLSPAADR